MHYRHKYFAIASHFIHIANWVIIIIQLLATHLCGYIHSYYICSYTTTITQLVQTRVFLVLSQQRSITSCTVHSDSIQPLSISCFCYDAAIFEKTLMPHRSMQARTPQQLMLSKLFKNAQPQFIVPYHDDGYSYIPPTELISDPLKRTFTL